MSATTTLWRPVGPAELALIAETEHRRFPPRLPEQPIFYPAMWRGIRGGHGTLPAPHAGTR